MGNACASPDAVRSFNSLEVDDGGLPPILPKLRRQELSDEGRNMLVDAMQDDSRSGSKSSAVEETHQQSDPHIKILIIDEVHRRHVAAFDTRETPSLAMIKEELARIRGVPPDLQTLVVANREPPQALNHELLEGFIRAGENILVHYAENHAPEACIRLSAAARQKTERGAALVLFDHRFDPGHNLFNLVDTGRTGDRWAYEALKQVHVTKHVVDFYEDGDLLDVFAITVEFFDPGPGRRSQVCGGRFVMRPKTWAKKHALSAALGPAFGSSGWHAEAEDDGHHAVVLDIDDFMCRGQPDASFETPPPACSTPQWRSPCVTRLTWHFKAAGVRGGLRLLLGWCNRFRLRLFSQRPYDYHRTWRTSQSISGHVKFEVSSELPSRLREWESGLEEQGGSGGAVEGAPSGPRP